MPTIRNPTQATIGLEKTGNRKGNQKMDKTVTKPNIKPADRHILGSTSLKSVESMERKVAVSADKLSTTSKREKGFTSDSDEEIKNSGAIGSNEPIPNRDQAWESNMKVGATMFHVLLQGKRKASATPK